MQMGKDFHSLCQFQ